ncbi:MAG: hypothetical protein DYG90_08820, partial [Chloroflexi bacterium CFX6]|nr:hypothetical protein [Chloroflexi bacterium CFX6]
MPAARPLLNRWPHGGVAVFAAGLALVSGLAAGWSGVLPARAQVQLQLAFNTLRLHGYPAANHPADAPHANRPATAGSSTQNDPVTGRIPEDAPYTDGQGPFDPRSAEAPRMDFATWDPAWISERLGEPALRAEWPGLAGIDEVSAAANIRAGGLGNASEKVWLRHWYEPQHLDKDIDADGRLTDGDGDGIPDAPSNPAPNNIDEWYPAIMTEATYMLVDNDPLPDRNPRPGDVHHSAPRPVCGAAGGTRIVFPVGISAAEANPAGAAVGHGLTRLDADFDGDLDMVNVTDEASLPSVLTGARVDFDGDGTLDTLNPDGAGLSCDELVVLHTDGLLLQRGQRAQFLDHYVEVRAVTNSSVSLAVYYTGDLVPRLIATTSVGIGAVVLAGDTSPVQTLVPGGTNLGVVPIGAWYAYVEDVDPATSTAIVMLGRALGAPCAAMESAPGVANRTAGGPWFLKRLYVDGHEYNVVAIQACGRSAFQYLTLRMPLPKVAVTIEQHSVRLQPYAAKQPLALPPPFNHEHTVLEDIVALDGFPPVQVPPGSPTAFLPRPTIHYMGGPVGPMAPALLAADPLPYAGRDPARPVGPYADVRATRWFYVQEDVDPAFLGQLKEKFGDQAPGQTVPASPADGFFYNEQIFTLPWNYTEFVLPDPADPAVDPQTGAPPYDPDNYLVTTAWTNPTARWRRWGMPDGPVPAQVPPVPPDLEVNATLDGGAPFGSP